GRRVAGPSRPGTIPPGAPVVSHPPPAPGADRGTAAEDPGEHPAHDRRRTPRHLLPGRRPGPRRAVPALFLPCLLLRPASPPLPRQRRGPVAKGSSAGVGGGNPGRRAPPAPGRGTSGRAGLSGIAPHVTADHFRRQGRRPEAAAGDGGLEAAALDAVPDVRPS